MGMDGKVGDRNEGQWKGGRSGGGKVMKEDGVG